MIVKYVQDRLNQTVGKDCFFTMGKNYIVLEVFYSMDNKLNIVVHDDNELSAGVIELKYFNIIDNRIPPNWVCELSRAGYYNIYPQEFYIDFWDDFHDGNPEAEKIFAEVYQKIKAFHDFKDEEDIKKMYNRGIHEKTAIILEDGWVMCPECSNAMKADPNIGEIICDNIHCQMKLNNPYAKNYPKDEK